MVQTKFSNSNSGINNQYRGTESKTAVYTVYLKLKESGKKKKKQKGQKQ